VLVPVPLTATVWGLPAALSKMFSVAVREPVVVGEKVTLMVQLAPAFTLDPHVFVSAKSLESPGNSKLVISNVPLPLLVKLMVCAVPIVEISCAGKMRLVGERVTAGAVTTSPIPVSATVCGLAGALSVKASRALRVPPAVGVNVTATVQLAPGARLVPQGFD
jgi:hypothetical protein